MFYFFSPRVCTPFWKKQVLASLKFIKWFLFGGLKIVFSAPFGDFIFLGFFLANPSEKPWFAWGTGAVEWLPVFFFFLRSRAL